MAISPQSEKLQIFAHSNFLIHDALSRYVVQSLAASIRAGHRELTQTELSDRCDDVTHSVTTDDSETGVVENCHVAAARALMIHLAVVLHTTISQ